MRGELAASPVEMSVCDGDFDRDKRSGCGDKILHFINFIIH
jgi:hypothetical protein